jgi:hypothetical protein
LQFLQATASNSIKAETDRVLASSVNSIHIQSFAATPLLGATLANFKHIRKIDEG